MDVNGGSSPPKYETIGFDPYLYIYIFILYKYTSAKQGAKEDQKSMPRLTCATSKVSVEAFPNKSWQVTFEVPSN
jgi:hypothetical protein